MSPCTAPADPSTTHRAPPHSEDPDFEPFLQFPVELRRIVYTTNAIESLNARFRKAAVRRGHFQTDEAALKVLYLVSISRHKNRTNPTGRINGWKHILNTLTIRYHDRLTAATN